MSKSVRRTIIAVLAMLSAVLISIGVYAFTPFNYGLSVRAEDTEPAEGNTIKWEFFYRDTENDRAAIEYVAEADRKSLVEAKCNGTGIPAENIVLTDEEGNPVTEAINVGTYYFTVNDGNEYTNPKFTLTITRQRINVYDYNNFAWLLAPSSELQSSQIYQYSYKSENSDTLEYYWSANEVKQAPDADWSDWKLVQNPSVSYSIIGYSDDRTVPYRLRLNRDQDVGENAYYTAEYSGDYESLEPGMHVATAVVTPAENYEFYLGETGTTLDIPDINVIFKPNADGTITVTKTWYIAYYTNEFLDISSKDEGIEKPVSYSIPSWSFGAYPEGGVSCPYLYHGDELRVDPTGAWQPSGYEMFTYYTDDGALNRSLIVNVTMRNMGGSIVNVPDWADDDDWRFGFNDVVTFTLTRNGTVICEDMPRHYWHQYINEYTPVGSYEVTFTALSVGIHTHKHWWSVSVATTCSTEYHGISNSYEFEVTAGKLTLNDEEFNAGANPDLASYEIDFDSLNGDYSKLFGVIADKISYSPFICSDDVEKSVMTEFFVSQDPGRKTYWAEHADEYYDYAPVLVYCISRISPGDYYTADSEQWQDIITKPDAYNVYYLAAMKNYDTYPSLAPDRFGYYFKVTLYQEVEAPALIKSEFTYDGTLHVAAVETDTRYNLTLHEQTNAGEYKAKLTLNDPAVYRWKNGADEDDPATVWLDFIVNPANVTLPVLESRTYNGNPIKPIFPDTTAYDITYDEYYDDGYVNADTYAIELKLKDAKNYVWVNSDGSKVEGVTADGKVTVTFTVSRLQNSWAISMEGSFSGWEWEAFSRQTNLLTAAPVSGTISYYVSSDEAGKIKVQGLEEVTVEGGMVAAELEETFINLPSGTYYLWGEVAETANYTAIPAESCEFTVRKAANGWVEEPNIIYWAEGSKPNLPTATPHRGTVEFEIVSETGDGVFYSTKDGVGEARLMVATAGSYILTAWVNETENYNGVAKYTKEFTVYPKSSGGSWNISPSIENWTEGADVIPDPVAESSIEGANIVFAYLTADMQPLDEKPLTAGSYYLVATAYVSGAEVATSTYPFVISPEELRQNCWKVDPGIKDWIAGEEAGVPYGEADAGEVTFTYKTGKGEILEEKPSEVGNYILVATVIEDGYEDLIAEIPFTVSERSGVDEGILIIIGVLTLLVIGLTSTMIVFIVKIKNHKKAAKAAKNDDKPQFDK